MALAWNLIFSCLIGGFLIFFAIIGIRIANIIDTFSSPGPVAIIVIMLLLCCGKPFVLWIVAQPATACRKKTKQHFVWWGFSRHHNGGLWANISIKSIRFFECTMTFKMLEFLWRENFWLNLLILLCLDRNCQFKICKFLFFRLFASLELVLLS